MQFEILLWNHPTHFYRSISHSLHNYDGCAPQVPRQLRGSAPAICRYTGTDIIVMSIDGNLSAGKAIGLGVFNIAVSPLVRGNGIVFRAIDSVVLYV